jgi:hypothetical protein
MATTRKCFHCNQKIDVTDKENLGHVLRYKDRYYHTTCFIGLAESRVARNDRHSASWQGALDNIEQWITDAKEAITTKVNPKTDALNDYLLLYYDVGGSFSARFWSTIMDIGNGVYRRRRCQPIDCDTLLDMWKYYQKELNDIRAYNKTHGKPMEGEACANYDLAILMGKYGAYQRDKAKAEAAELEREKQRKETIKIDYSKIVTNTRKENILQDISSLVDDIF